MRGGRAEVVTRGTDGTRRPYTVERLIGVEPLYQFLTPAPGGRYQVTELAFDPVWREWFDVFGKEDRQPGEWGHWSGRGMNWNSMCAACHNTGLRKNFKETTDTYETTMAEMGVGCAACHGPMADHVAWQRKRDEVSTADPTIRRMSRDQMLDTCGSCHARRSELTGDARPGERFLDHYAPVIPDHTGVYYADGQVNDEDYEYVSFLGSGMYTAGVRCIDCHEPHSGKIRTPGNALCLSCHQRHSTSGFGKPIPGPEIDSGQHSHHPMGKPGSYCVDCHMPQTVYMERHLRRDHGFTIPDPLLTKEHGIPNACNRCHEDRSVNWAIGTVERWYGERMERPTRTRTRWIARARAGDQSAVKPLLTMGQKELNPLWRAVAVGLLDRWAQEETVTTGLIKRMRDSDPLVRAMAARALGSWEPMRNRKVHTALRALLKDPVRMVRVEAAWALRSEVDPDSVAGRDLLRYLRYNADQPVGALQIGTYYASRKNSQKAIFYFRRAVAWDVRSAPLRHAVGVSLNLLEKKEEALRELREACQLAPENPDFKFDLALLLGELGHVRQAADTLADVVRIDPTFTRAWYNLGLARSVLGDGPGALQALERAETFDPLSADIPFARATILHRLGRTDEAYLAARRTLTIDASHTGAAKLLRVLKSARR